MNFLVLLALMLTGDSKYLIEDPSQAQRVDYLILAGDAYADKVDELAAYREKQGYAVGIVKASTALKKFESIRAFIAHAVEMWKAPAPKFLLIVGGVEAVPTEVRKTDHPALFDVDLATDYEFACPVKELEPALHVGRFPCHTAGELEVMIRKTIDYEAKLEAGTWQKRVRFIGGVGGFGDQADAAIEKLFTQVVSTTVPPGYDVDVAYANPKSPYCPFPPKFNEHSLRILNEGSLLYVFVGHGSRDSVQDVRWEKKYYPILSESDAGKIDVKEGRPIMIVIACSTGQFDSPKDCVGTVFFRSAKGPVAFLGGSRVTDPYGNALVGQGLALHLLDDTRTLGEGITAMKRDLATHEKNKFNQQLDLVATMMGEKADELEAIRKDTVRHYNLLGDPALVLRKPRPLKMSLEGNRVSIEADAQEATLTVECAREKMLVPSEKIDRKDPEFEKKIEERFRNANNKVMKAWTVKLAGGKGAQEIELPVEPGKYWIKASAPGLFGALSYTVAAKD